MAASPYPANGTRLLGGAREPPGGRSGYQELPTLDWRTRRIQAGGQIEEPLRRRCVRRLFETLRQVIRRDRLVIQGRLHRQLRGVGLRQARERDFIAHDARAAAVQIGRVVGRLAFRERRVQKLVVDRLERPTILRPTPRQQAVVLRDVVSPEETRRVIALGVPDQLLVNLNLTRRGDRVTLPPEVRLRRSLPATVRADVLALENPALAVDDEPGLVGPAR